MTLPLVPFPASVVMRDEAPFRLTPGTPVTGDADAAPHARALLAALARRHTLLAPREPRRIPPASEDSAPTVRGPRDSPSLVAAPVAQDAATAAPGIHLARGEGAPESYVLEVTSARVTVTGADAAGLFYGIQTLGQLAATGEIPAVRIADAPRFPYRGVMLDVARHFHPVETVLAYIDRAAALKFNRLHLHLTDDQGWRLEIAAHPELTARGAGSSAFGDAGGFFTQDDYRRIVTYAVARHLTVVPEIDLPGHTHAVSLSHPELCEPPVVTDRVREVTELFGGGLPVPGEPYHGIAVGFSSLRIDDERTYALLHDVLGEVARLTPGPYLHIGGDEALGTPPERYDAFVGRVTEMVRRLGKVPMAWHEAGAAPSLAPGTIGQYWGFVTPTDGMDAEARAFVRGGGSLVLSPADAIYLDMKPHSGSALGLAWANGPTSLERSYRWDPATVIEGVDESDVLGVTAPLWTETVRTLADIDALVFPRIGSAAEAAWSRDPYGTGERTWESFRERVAALAPCWRAQGFAMPAESAAEPPAAEPAAEPPAAAAPPVTPVAEGARA
ncbi:family 20 glycosylhydrolase [Microbacterium sp. No. 7]|uniref:family 20 glycosylhydrolase n=1 Tax=Microbacterium sp. No. 7 TaxID=1714373 RepID=UPI0006ED00E0|nr:family 20 glycosylhydrolase [Microbacterium sp. No. 7]ALJ19200.1 hypothetical protein AOA12_04495 [Microbacterium sp. No. 7]